MTAKPPGSERATLSRDLGDFLIELSIALHKHAMYPQGHPSLAPAARGVARRAGLLLEERATLSLGVARRQLVIEGVATDPKHPVLGELAGRLHRHHLGAVTFSRGVDEDEVTDVLSTLSTDAERGGEGEALGLGPPEALRRWAHVRLHPLTYERLELVDEGPEAGAADRASGPRAAQLWVGLARAALATEPTVEAPPSTEPTVIARAIDDHPRAEGEAYDQVIVGYLLQIAEELKAAGSAEAVALRRRTSRLIRSLKPESLRRLVAMGGDFAQRRRFVSDATDGMAVDAVLELVQAAADTSRQTISHSLVRMLSKLASHAEAGAEGVRLQADAALRDQVRGLLQGWTLEDPNPGAYGAVLQRMSRAAPLFVAPIEGEHATEPDRIIAMALELDFPAPTLPAALDRVVGAGRVAQLLDGLAGFEHTGVAAVVWDRVTAPDVVGRLASASPVDFATLDRLLPQLGPAALEPLLDVLAGSDSRATRRGLLDRLARVGAAVGPLAAQRLSDERWYVVRNMLVLLDAAPVLPEGVSPAQWVGHPDARVRREALKLAFKAPAERERALVAALGDADDRVQRLALAAAQEGCPASAVPLVVRLARDPKHAPEIRVLAIRVLGAVKAPAALEGLLQLADGGTTLLGRRRLAAKSLELVAALAALARGWGSDARAGAVLAVAAASHDADIRRATDPSRARA